MNFPRKRGAWTALSQRTIVKMLDKTAFRDGHVVVPRGFECVFEVSADGGGLPRKIALEVVGGQRYDATLKLSSKNLRIHWSPELGTYLSAQFPEMARRYGSSGAPGPSGPWMQFHRHESGRYAVSLSAKEPLVEVFEPERVPLEKHLTDRYGVPKMADGEAGKPEGRLVYAFADWLKTTEGELLGHKSPVEGGLRTDLYYDPGELIIEAKASVQRKDVPTALGQRLDYRAQERNPAAVSMAVLLPSDPGNNLKRVISTAPALTIHRVGDRFEVDGLQNDDARAALRRPTNRAQRQR